MHNEKRNNFLKTIFDEYPGIWNKANMFNAALNDYIPENKIYCNLLRVALEEGILSELSTKKSIIENDIENYCRKMIEACDCSRIKSREIILMCIDAFGIEKITQTDFGKYEPGKQLCNLLRSIRMKIAKENNITYTPEECTHKSPCMGTCQKCDLELKYLTRELEKREKIYGKVNLRGIALEDIQNINEEQVNNVLRFPMIEISMGAVAFDDDTEIW